MYKDLNIFQINEDQSEPTKRFREPLRPRQPQIHWRFELKYIDSDSAIEHRKNQFNPYTLNYGTVVGVAGEDFVVIAGDTRLSEGYSIVTRDESKLVKLSDTTILATSGMFADFCELKKVLQTKLEIYEYKIGRKATTEGIANLLSKTLYGRRFFPYYTFNLVGGLDKNGKGILYGYDAIGSYDNASGLAQGSGAHMILPLLDAELVGYNNPHHATKPPLTIEAAVDLIERAFRSAAERDIYTGDKLEIIVLNKEGTKTIWKQLRRDWFTSIIFV